MISQADFEMAAKIINCDVAAVKAVTEVEARGGGFNPDGSPKILFEGHWFHRYTKGKFAASDPDICYPKWTKVYYGKTWQEENKRLNRAIALDKVSALLSASWGLFQIMGFNYAVAGYRTVESYVAAMRQGEGPQLAAFCSFVKNSGLGDELRDHRWDDFARLYNGPEYKKNDYAGKLARAWKKAGGV